MGFRTGAYATVWEAIPHTDTITKLQISVSVKDKNSGEYVTEFSGFASCIGTALANKAAGLRRQARIKIGDCDVTTVYDKTKDKQFTNFKIFSFEIEGGRESQSLTNDPEPVVDHGELDDSGDNADLPF